MRDQSGALSVTCGQIQSRPSVRMLIQENYGLLLLALLVFLLNQGLEYVLLRHAGADYRVLCGWDCGWYTGVVESGYDLQPHAHPHGDAANWAFFPAFPLAAEAIGAVANVSAGAALLMTAKLFFLFSIFAFVKFAQVWAPGVPAWLAAAVVGFQPYAIYGNVGYTESMFLLFTCLAFLALGKGRFVAAGLFGAVLSAVRPVGVLFVVPLLIAGLRRLPTSDLDERGRILLGAMLVPVGLSMFMIFLYQHTGDALAFSHVQIAWDRIPASPVEHLWQGLWGGDPMPQLWAVMSLVALAMVAVLFFKREYELASFSLVATLVPLSTGLLAMPRYLWWQAPLLLLIAQLLNVHFASLRWHGRNGDWSRHEQHGTEAHGVELRVWMLLLPLSLWGSVVMTMAWINGEWFVV
ncbi:MAG: hypothetical protein Q8L60_07725 [Gammaproteobacteria bacterium]|nr:hypothetical protein [Gammaproteobacteria bacterium]MDP2348242.1 hypothetical protein [Gammaproteobacteria bacterium]